MDMIIADSQGKQIMQLLSVEFDCELNDGDRDFDLYLSSQDFDSRIKFGCQFFIPGTEIGGIIGRRSADSSIDTISMIGYTWRGLLTKKIVIPPDGQTNYICTGDLNFIARNLIDDNYSGVIVGNPENCGQSVNGLALPRFCSVLDALDFVFSSVGYKVVIAYNMGEPNGSGQVVVSAEPVQDYSNEIEISGNDQLAYLSEDIQNGVNHLIIGVEDATEESAGTVIDLYVQKDGTIGTTQQYFGIDEIAEFYDAGSSTPEATEPEAIDHLKEVKNNLDLDLSILDLQIDAKIGDYIGGYDYLSGQVISQKITNIVYTYKNGLLSKEYKTEKEES